MDCTRRKIFEGRGILWRKDLGCFNGNFEDLSEEDWPDDIWQNFSPESDCRILKWHALGKKNVFYRYRACDMQGRRISYTTI